MADSLNKQNGLINRLWHEIEPVLCHGIIVAFIVLTTAGLVWLSERTLPNQYAEKIHNVDRILVPILLWLYGVYTITFLLIRLCAHLWEELREIVSKKPPKNIKEPSEAMYNRVELERKE